MKFGYRRIDLADPFSKKRYILRPIIPVSLKYNASSIRFEALIDSGADFSIFPIEIAHKLNIPINRGKKVYFSGVGWESFEGTIADIFIEIGENRIKTKTVFTEARENTGILGQKGFFDNFDIKLSYQKQLIEIEKV